MNYENKSELKSEDKQGEYFSQDELKEFWQGKKSLQTGRLIIRKAASAGFCFGVQKAVDTAHSMREKADSEKVDYMLGKILHNDLVVDELLEKGFNLALDAQDPPAGSRVLIRAHGVSPEVIERLQAKSCEIIDKTCPYVAKIHALVREAEARGDYVLIVGDKKHPEIIGIYGEVKNKDKVSIIEDIEDCRKFVDEYSKTEKEANTCKVEKNQVNNDKGEYLSIFVQTTYDPDKFKEIEKYIAKFVAKFRIFDTICNVTLTRFDEATKLAADSDIFFVLGSSYSSNTAKLKRAAEKACESVYLVQRPEDLLPIIRDSSFNKRETPVRVGISAGASTPGRLIREVIHLMTEHEVLQNQEEAVEQGTVEEETGQAAEAQVSQNASAEASSDVRNETHEANASEEAKQQAEENGDISFTEFIENIPRLKPGTVVTGNIVRYDDDFVYVDVKDKSEGKVPRQEFEPDFDLDQACKDHAGIEVFVRHIKNSDMGKEIILSKQKVDFNKHKEAVAEAYKERTPLMVKVNSVLRHGVLAGYGSIDIYIHRNQLDLRSVPVEELPKFVGQNLEVIITSFDTSKHRLRVSASRRALLNAERRKKAAELWETIEVGNEYDGIVRNITNFGAFVDIGGVDGLVHISQLSWKRIKHPSEIVQVGDTMHVFVKDFDKAKKRISLGFKRPENNPFFQVEERFPVGSIVRGIVVRTVPFGAFIEIAPGLEALCHISQISRFHLKHPNEALQEGMEVDARVVSASEEEGKMSISIRDVEPIDPPGAMERQMMNMKNREEKRGGRKPGRKGGRRRSDDNEGLSYTDSDNSASSSIFGLADITVSSKAGAEVIEKLKEEEEQKAEAEAKRKAEAEAKKAAEEKAKREAEEKAAAEAEEAAKAEAEEESTEASEGEVEEEQAEESQE